MKPLENLENLVIDKNLPLDQVLIKINDGKEGVLFVLDDSKLIGIITDGDIRREIILNGIESNSPAYKFMNKKPIFANLTENDFSKYFNSHDIEHLPVVDKNLNLIKAYRSTRNDISLYLSDHIVLIIAGGLGTRMGLKYKNTPKCLLEINNVTILERILNQAFSLNPAKVIISVNHEYQKLVEFVKNSKFNERVDFFIEEEPLGTAGSLIEISNANKDKNILSFNSDIIFNLDFNKLINYTSSSSKTLTVCTAEYEVEIPYGVLEKNIILNNDFEIIEKPRVKYNVVAGIYHLKKNSLHSLETKKINMDELIRKISEDSGQVNYFNIGNNWMDIGNEKQLKLANKFIDY